MDYLNIRECWVAEMLKKETIHLIDLEALSSVVHESEKRPEQSRQQVS